MSSYMKGNGAGPSHGQPPCERHRTIAWLVVEVPNRIDTIDEHIDHHANDVMRHYHFFGAKVRAFSLNASILNLPLTAVTRGIRVL